MNKKRAIITVGAPGSGKSTWKDEFITKEESKGNHDWLALERDELRLFYLTNKSMGRSGTVSENYLTDFYALPASERKAIEELISAEFNAEIESGAYNLIFSNTNLSKKQRDKLVRKLVNHGYMVEIIAFDPSLVTLLHRNRVRTKSVDTSVLIDFWQRLQHQKDSFLAIDNVELRNVIMRYEVYAFEDTVGYNNDSCIIVDLDGTIAHNDINPDTGKPYRSWYADDVGNDRFDDVVFHMAYSLAKKYEADIIFLTGRKCSAWESTSYWLKCNIDYSDEYGEELSFAHDAKFVKDMHYQLYMRQLNDNRPDTEAKRDMYNTFIKPRYNEVIAVFDDRNMMVDMWHDMGLKVINCGDYRETF